MATCIRKPVERLRPQRLLGKTSAFPLLPGRKKAAAANTSTAGATAAVEIWGAGAYSHSAPHPPLPPPPSASRPLLFVYSLRYPSGRRRRRRHQSPIRSKLDSMVKHTHALSSTQGWYIRFRQTQARVHNSAVDLTWLSSRHLENRRISGSKCINAEVIVIVVHSRH